MTDTPTTDTPRANAPTTDTPGVDARMASMPIARGAVIDQSPEADPRTQFDVVPGTIYMDAATYGLPPRATVAAMHAALDAWAGGSADWIEDWDRPAEEARADFASLVGVPEASVALLPAVSVGVSWVADALRPGDEVIVPANEFTSTLFPFLVAKRRGVVVREVGIGELAEAVSPRTTLVATSLVQMQTGLRAHLSAIRQATDRVGARLLLDATQAVPFLKAGEDLEAADYVLTHGYKHLLCPRGAAFMVVRTDRQADLEPTAANWRAANEPYGRYFEGPLTLGPGARRFDVSLAWHSWVGARVSLRMLRDWSKTGALDAVWARAESLARGARLPVAESTLVCVPVGDPDGARVALAAAGIRASVRGSAVRFSVHLWNSDEDVRRTLDVLAPFTP